MPSSHGLVSRVSLLPVKNKKTSVEKNILKDNPNNLNTGGSINSNYFTLFSKLQKNNIFFIVK